MSLSAEMKYGMPRIRSRAGNELRISWHKGQAASSGVARQAKSRLWRVEKLGDLPDVTFEEACQDGLRKKLIKNLSIQIKAGLVLA